MALPLAATGEVMPKIFKLALQSFVNGGLFLATGILVFFLIGPASAQPAPVAKFVNPPSEISIGEDFAVTLTFENAGAVGYGPYIDLFVPAVGIDATASSGPCDGITFLSAEAHFASPMNYSLQTAALPHEILGPPSCTSIGGTNITVHPYAAALATIPGAIPAGYELAVIELPFSSYFAAQGPITVTVQLHLSDHADAGVPLTIFARGGFRYGTSQQPPVVQGALVQTDITPNVFTVSKSCVLQSGVPCPEDETATGPSFPFQYVITADVDTGLTVNELTLSDCLDGNLQFRSVVSVSEPGSVVQVPSTDTPGGCIEVVFPDPILGVPGPEATVVIEVYVPEFHADGSAILDAKCAFQEGLNVAKAKGWWTPIDPRDLSQDNSLISSAEHVIIKKCLALQKSVTPAVAIPGNVLEYTANFQVSDFFTLGNMVLTDLLSDGQTFDANSVVITVGSGSAFSNNLPILVPFVSVCDVPAPWAYPPQLWLSPPQGNGHASAMADDR